MRNDARPIGEDAHDSSPIDERDSAFDSAQADPEPVEGSVTPVIPVISDRQSHIVHRRAEDGDDVTMPTGDSTLPTKI
jgi:hypothetical protein